MKDQLHYWNDAHAQQRLHAHSQIQTVFAEDVNKAMPSQATFLELGCGEGNDSQYFAKQGHNITATDFSDIVIEQNQTRWQTPNLKFIVQDISKHLAFADEQFDVVYARLSLHYFSDAITRKVFHEIARVLKPEGYVFFMCKSTDDSLYGQGVLIEQDMFELDGHVRHFFSKEYVSDLLQQAGLNAESIDADQGQLYDHMSAFIKVIARKSS